MTNLSSFLAFFVITGEFALKMTKITDFADKFVINYAVFCHQERVA